MASLNYVVTASMVENVSVEAIVGGVLTTAIVPRLVVEATSSDASMGHTFRLGQTQTQKISQ